MALKKVKRYTISLPKVTILKLEAHIPKSKRSKFIAEILEEKLAERKEEEGESLEDIKKFWEDLADSCPRKTNKTAVELVREDRMSH